MAGNKLLEVIAAIGGLRIEIWSDDLDHAISGHPEVTLKKVRSTLEEPFRVIQSKSSNNACLFYSVEVVLSETESLFFCVVVVVNNLGVGKMVTAYDADFVKTGKELYSRGR